MSAFTLGRMRHLDLLALWHQLHPDNHHGGQHCLAARLSKESLAAAILNGPA